MAGIIYGVGVGPGDPELLTLKAAEVIRKCDMIGIPAEKPEDCTAYRIGVQAVPEMRDKPVVCVEIPMTRDEALLEAAYDKGSSLLAKVLEKGNSVAFLNLGDPTLYGSYMKLHERLQKAGFSAQIISGVPSFCAVAAALGKPLALGGEEVHILPGAKEPDTLLQYPGTKVVMKAGGELLNLRAELLEAERQGRLTAFAAANCGMENEKIYPTLDSVKSGAGYFTTLIVKDN